MRNIFDVWKNFINQAQISLMSEEYDVADAIAQNWLEQDYPTGEDWKYLSFVPVSEAPLQWTEETGIKNKVKEEADFLCIEINDFSRPFSVSFSNDQLKVTPEKDEAGAEKWFQALSSGQDNPFLAMAGAFPGMGLKLTFKEQVKKPLLIRLNLDAIKKKDQFAQVQLYLENKAGASNQVFVETQAYSFDGLFNLCVRAESAKESGLSFFYKEQGGEKSHIMYNFYSDVKGQATLNHFDFSLPSRWGRHNLTVHLNEKQAQTELRGTYLNHHDYFTDHHTSIFHQVGHTHSQEDYRGILSGQAKAVFNGKVVVAEKASQSNSNQINKNLMLSKKAEVDTKPELQIYNDDVKATHGATVGQLDEEQRFYLQSRGYPAQEAAKLLAKAFVYDLIEDQAPLVKNFFDDALSEALHQVEEAQ